MIGNDMNTWDGVEERVKQWWLDLQKERKCNGTCAIFKLVNKISEEEQEKVRQLIASLIKEGISSNFESKDVLRMTTLCSAINGCFDNFFHAADGVNIAFNEIIEFIHFCIDECCSFLFPQQTPKCNAVQALKLLHSLSRILVLVLKLRRPMKCERKSDPAHQIDNFVKAHLSKLSFKVSRFLRMDDILMDTKCNFVMGALLIREIILESREKLMEYHENFLMTLPEILIDDEFELNILKFLLSNGVLNTWSNILIDSNSVTLYLRFFIQLCESYSSETTVVLNVSRALFLLIRNDSFKDCVMKFPDRKQISSLLSCVWMLLDHPVACIRHSAKNFLQILVSYEKFKTAMLDSLSSLPNDKRSYFITLAALANETNLRSLLKSYPQLPNKLQLALRDPTLVTHVIFALENLILNDSMVIENFPEWCETWILPLLVSLTTVGLVVAADIEKLLDGLFKRYPSTIIYIINKWPEPKSDEQLRFIITAVKIYNRHGLKQLNKEESNNVPEEKKWKYMISEKLLKLCLIHNDDDIRVSAFSLIIQGLKTTEKYTEADFNLIRLFFTYNLNNQHPATRQKILSLIKKMLTRFAVSLIALRRTLDSSLEDVNNYSEFKNWLVEFCFSNIFDGANFNRLNTVLSTLLYVIEYTGNIEVDESILDVYWRRILVALRSSYEENKIMAVTLAKKLNIHNLLVDSDEMTRKLLEKAIRLSGKMEPPNVLTGSYLVKILIEFPSFGKFVDYSIDPTGVDSKLICIMILSSLLENQVKSAEDNLIKAAAVGPMYGTLFAIRLIMQEVNFSDIDREKWQCCEMRKLWPKFINMLIKLCFRMIRVVSPVVNSSSPEGHLPSDFQYDFQLTMDEDLTALRKQSTKDEKKWDQKYSSDSVFGIPTTESLCQQVENLEIAEGPRGLEQLSELTDSFIRRFNRIFLMVYNSNSFSQEMASEFAILLEKCLLLLNRWSNFEESETSKKSDYVNCLCSINKKLEKCLKIYKKNSFTIGKPTAQILLLCAWRSIKEACLFLGDFMSKLSLEKAFELELITEETATDIGEQLRILLCEIKHRGAFEQAYVGFCQVMNAFWKSTRINLSELPVKWLREILDEIKLPLEEQKMKFCSSRRSAGLPFLVQAIISSELQCINSGKIQTLDLTMNTLLGLVEEEETVNLECKIHSLNILRALFKHAMLGEHVVPFVSRALMVSVRGSRADAWSIRNSSSLLFSSLVIRIFGVSRNKDALSKKNKMTSRIFFQRYPELYEFFLSEMRLGCEGDQTGNGYHPQPNVFHVLLILGRLYPPPIEDSINMDFTEFLPVIDTSCHSPTLKIRELGARALVPLISPEKLTEELGIRFTQLHNEKCVDRNQTHGVLLQIKTILNEISYEDMKNMRESLKESGSVWIKNSQWLLNNAENCRVPFLIQIAYTQILHLMYKACPSLKGEVKSVYAKDLYGEESLATARNVPGYFAFRETFNFVKFDMAASDYIETGNCSQLSEVFLTMLRSEIDEVKSIPLRFLNCVTLENKEESIEEDDVNSITLKIRDLACVQNEEFFEIVKKGILMDSSIMRYIVEYIKTFLLNEEECVFSPHKVTTRLWMSVISSLLLKDIITADDFYKICNKMEEKSLVLDSLLNLVDCGDSDISVSAFICYSVFFFDEMMRGTKELTHEVISNFTKLMFSFSDQDADVKQREAAAEIFNKYCLLFNHDLFLNDNQLFSIWTLPVRLMVDDEPIVRKSIARLVPKYHKYLNENRKDMIIPLEEDSVSQLTTVPSRAQEDLLDCYINLLGERNIFHLVTQMVSWSLSAYVNTINCDHITKQNEAGVFEKGNPNPFCEESAFGNLILDKLIQLKSLVDVNSLFDKKLDLSHIKSLQDFLPTVTLPSFPETLHKLSFDIVHILTENKTESEDEAMSLLSVYIHTLKKSLDV